MIISDRFIAHNNMIVVDLLLKYLPSRNQKFFAAFCICCALLIVVYVLVNLDDDLKDTSSYMSDFNSNLSTPDEFTSHLNDSDIEKYLFCLIKTTPGALKSNKALTVYKVWARRCSNYRFISLIPNESMHTAVKYGQHLEIAEPFYLLQPEGLKVELYGKITDKLYSAMRYIYSRFGDFHWYLIADDDAYINMENMMLFLSTKNSSWPVTYGHDFRVIVEQGYHSGGCGYLLSGEAFRRVSRVLVNNTNFCQNSGIDDVDLAVCLRKLGVRMNSSLDELGRERFLPVNFRPMYFGPVPDWLNAYSANKPKQGVNCCSDTIIGIHYMQPKQQILLDLAFNTERHKTSLLNNMTNSKFNVTFKNVVDNYMSLVNQYEKEINV